MARCEWAIEQERIRREVLDEKMVGASAVGGGGTSDSDLQAMNDREFAEAAAKAAAAAGYRPPGGGNAWQNAAAGLNGGANAESAVCVIS